MLAALAQASAQTALNQMLPWLGALFLAALLGGGLLFYLRRRLLMPDRSDQPKSGFLEDLRRLRDRGEISEDEFESARLLMIARATGKDPQVLREEAVRKAGGRVAEPGFDLIGRPLPKPPGAEIAESNPGTSTGGPAACESDAPPTLDQGPGPHDPSAD